MLECSAKLIAPSQTSMRKSIYSSRTLQAGFCAALVALCFLAAFAQSGRRVRKPTPAPVSVPEPTPTPNKPADKPKPALTFIVGMDKFGDFSRIPLGASTAVLRTCAHRLDEPDSAKADITSQDMTRADAIRRAKSEKEAHVVLLNLRPNSLSGRAGSDDDPYNVYIEYSVFAPTTAKEVTSGRVFPGSYQNKGVIVGPKSSSVYSDYYVIQAAKKTAERILAHFHVNVINPRP